MRNLIIWGIALLLLLSCRSSEHGLAPNQRQPLTEAQKFKHDKVFYEALYHFNAKRYDAAYELLNLALKIDSTSPEAHYRMGELLEIVSTSRDTLKRQQLANHFRLATCYAPQTKHYLDRYATLLLNKADYEGALSYAQKSIALSRDAETYYFLSHIYFKLGRYEEAIQAIDHFANMEGESLNFIEVKAQLLNSINDTTQLFQLLRQKMDKHPDQADYTLLLTQYYNKHNRALDSERILLGKLQEDPQNLSYQIELFRTYYLFMPQRKAQFWDTFRRIVHNDLMSEEDRVRFVAEYFKDKKDNQEAMDSLMNIFESVIYTPLTTGELPSFYISVLTQLNRPSEDILRVIDRTLELSPDDIETRKYQIQLVYKSGDFDKLLSCLREDCRQVPGYLWFYNMEFAVRVLNGQPMSEAKWVLEEGIKNNDDPEDPLLAEVYNSLGDCYQDVGNLSLAFEYYEKSLEIDPYNGLCLNNYAYFLALEGQNLDKAEALALRALEVEPNSPIYLDTYAWVLYMQNKYDEAKATIDKTLERLDEVNSSTDTYYDHAGDIYLKCGQQKEACLFWIKAFEQSEDEVERKKIHKKIRRYARPPIQIPKL